MKSSSDHLPPSQNWHFVVQLNFHFSSLTVVQLFLAPVVELFETVQKITFTASISFIIIIILIIESSVKIFAGELLILKQFKIT